MQQNNFKDPAIKLFGKKIPLNSDAELPPISVVDLPSSNRVVERENEVKTDKQNSAAKITETTQQEVDDCCLSQDTGESADRETVGDGNVNPKTPSINEESARSKTSSIDKEQSDGTNTQGKTLKKPDKVLPCPRCHSMDTKFCYYNNYNTNQPRHLCKACQRYWTAGGIMRNVPVGSGRRKNKNSTAHYRHIAISDALQAVPNGSPGLKANGRILSFGLDMPMCDSMAAVLSVADGQARNGVRNGFHGSCKGGENGSDDCSSGSSVTISNSTEECGRQGCASEPLMRSVNGFASPIPCLPGVPWQYPWNSVLPLPPAFCPPPSGFPMSFSPPFWNYSIAPGTWKIPLLSPQSSSSNRQVPSNPVSPTLGKHSRDQDTLKQHDLEEKELSGKNKNRCVLVPKTLRIDDPDEAAKSSIWATLGIQNECFSGKLFKPLQSKNGEKNHQVPETCPVLTANPAALSRSINFHEST